MAPDVPVVGWTDSDPQRVLILAAEGKSPNRRFPSARRRRRRPPTVAVLSAVECGNPFSQTLQFPGPHETPEDLRFAAAGHLPDGGARGGPVPATCVETWYGSAAARFGFYAAWWFTLLCVLLGVNILAALLVRFPWKKRQIGFVLAHLGMLALLVGCLLTRRHGVNASLSVFEGQGVSRAYEDSLHFELSRGDDDGFGAEVSVPFSPGPFNWGDYAGLCWFPWRLSGWGNRACCTIATAFAWRRSTTTPIRGRFPCRGWSCSRGLARRRPTA